MKRLVTLFIAILFFQKNYSQDFLGYSASEYAGVTAIDIQPANLADNRFRFDMTLGATSLKVYNNYVGLKRYAYDKINIPGYSGRSMGQPIGGDSLYSSTQRFEDSFLETREGGKSKSVYLSNRIVLPSFLVEINHKNTIAFTWDVRNYANIDGISPDLARILYRNVKETGFWGQKLNNLSGSIQAMSWAEYGVTYARVLKEDNEHAFKVAARVKIMQGLGAAYMYVKDLKYTFNNDTTLSITSTAVNYGHSSNLYEDADKLKYKFVSNPGIGFDLGFVYEWRPDFEKYKYELDGEKNLWRRDKSKYKFKAGLSILDIGGVKFHKGQLSNDFTADVAFWNLKQLKFDSAAVFSFDDTLKKRFLTNTSAKKDFYMHLPTAISAQADYKIWKDFDVNFIFYYAFQFKNSPTKVHDFTSISITPAWDHKWFGVFMPLQYHQLYGFAYGTCVRLGPLIIGTDNMGAFFGHKSIYGADAYMLLKIPVPFGAPKDRDKDKVSDKKDLCKKVPGTWEFKGCPDTDGDHIQDKDDKCPLVAGTLEMQGCPDKDGDKITDLEDECPDVAGLAEFKGCPDRDGDKIIDKNDTCPDIAGLKVFNGCPDKDGDSIPDRMDNCPDVAGPKQYKGCPDQDGDGILDKEDMCVDVPGVVENKGCPWPDSDKDGVYDKDDECPDIAGVPGSEGCPPVKVEEAKILEQAFEHLEFATGKDIIKPTSFKSLDDLSKILKAHSKDWTLKLAGHTDNAGPREKNLLLSEKRAKAVMKYLVKKGVNPAKVKVEWYGPDKPIADNATEEGRQKNRRVEMKIVFK